MAPPDAPFWKRAQQPLPVERGDYRLIFPRLGWTVTGRHETLDIQIQVAGGNGDLANFEFSCFLWRRLVESFFQRPFRPDNMNVRYGLRTYSAVDRLGGSLDAVGHEEDELSVMTKSKARMADPPAGMRGPGGSESSLLSG